MKDFYLSKYECSLVPMILHSLPSNTTKNLWDFLLMMRGLNIEIHRGKTLSIGNLPQCQHACDCPLAIFPSFFATK